MVILAGLKFLLFNYKRDKYITGSLAYINTKMHNPKLSWFPNSGWSLIT